MFICSNCSASFPKWSWKCMNCNAWNSLEQSKIEGKKTKLWTGKVLETNHLQLWNSEAIDRYKSASSELDGVLGGGISEGSLILLSGEPGIGKSTLALQMSEWYASSGRGVLYISGEEHIGQISARAARLWVKDEKIDIVTDSDFDSIFLTIERSSVDIVIIDSLSVLASSSIEGSPGSISQIRIMTEMCMHVAKKLKKSIILIGHVTKDGSISGPKSLEHLVDVVLFLEWVRTENYRILRALKNRFWSTDAVGLFRMEEGWLIDLPNPGLEFIDTMNRDVSGSALSFAMEWNRPLLIEIEALTTYTKFGYPKRSARGISQWKIDLLLAVISKFMSLKLESYDVYLNIGRGLTLSEPGIDLACVAAILSSKKEKTVGDIIWLWEVSLTGMVKSVYMLERRIMEAYKLGFKKIIIPFGYEWKIPSGMEYTFIKNIKEIEWLIK